MYAFKVSDKREMEKNGAGGHLKPVRQVKYPRIVGGRDNDGKNSVWNGQ